MSEKEQPRYLDKCGWCGHTLKVFSKAWLSMISMWGIYYTANYCTEKTCVVVGCQCQCEQSEDNRYAASRVMKTIQRRRTRIRKVKA